MIVDAKLSAPRKMKPPISRVNLNVAVLILKATTTLPRSHANTHHWLCKANFPTQRYEVRIRVSKSSSQKPHDDAGADTKAKDAEAE